MPRLKQTCNRIGLAAVCAVFLGACVTVPYGERLATFEGGLRSYVGQNSDVLLLAFGAPSQTAYLNSGGRLFEYSRSETVVSGGGTFTSFNTVRQRRQVRDENGLVREVSNRVQVPVQQRVPITQQNLNCNIRWKISPQNIVQAFAWDGNDCF